MRVMPAVIWRPIARLPAGNRLFAAVLVPAMAFGPASLTRRGAGGGPDGRLADAGHDQRDLTADAA